MDSENVHTTIDDQISDYFTQRLNPEQTTELNRWINASSENRNYFEQMHEIWFSSISADKKERFNKNEAYQRFLIYTENAEKKQTRKKKFSLRPVLYGAAAIAWVCIISVTSYWTGIEQIKKQFADMVIEAPLGSKTKLYLPDGTLVWLNAGSKITYSQGFGVEDRKLNLSGEGYFEVTKNKELPFEVRTEELYVNVLGTKFNFRNYPEDQEITVSLLEGKVALQNNLNSKCVSDLFPNQRATLNKGKGELQIHSSKAKYDSEWTNGILFFDEELLPDIAKELERSYNVKIHLADEYLETFRFYGNFERKELTIEDILKMLASTGKIKYKIDNKEIVLYKQ